MARWTTQTFIDITLRYAVPVEELTDKKERKARRIIDAATALFLKHGYRKTSIDDVARDVGIGKGTVYLYFGTKADLLIHCILAEKAGPAGMRMWHTMSAMTSPIELLRALLQGSFDMMYELPLTARIAGGDHELELVLSELGGDTAQLMASTRIERLNALLAPLSRVDDASLSAITHGLASLLEAVPEITRQAQRLGMDRQVHSQAMTDILLAGLLSTLGTDPSDVGVVDFNALFGIEPEVGDT